jgi:molybdenum cofactor cytidylyltransferase
VIAAIVLAAGRATRFGAQKLLAPLRGKPLAQWAVERVLASAVDDVVVVVGGGGDALRAALFDLPVRCVVNPDSQDGMSSSLRAGISALAPGTEAALVVLGDQPDVHSEVIDRVVAAYRQTGKPVVVPVYADGRGHPVLFGASVFPELMAVRGDRGGREVIARDPERVATVAFARPAPADVDTREDYDRLSGRAGLPDG